MADKVNWFDQAATTPGATGGNPAEPPPPESEDDYGPNVRPLKGKRKQPAWKAGWHLSDNGSPLPTLHNVMLALRFHPTLSDLVRYDEMLRAPLLMKQIPNTPADLHLPHRLRDADVLAIQEEIQLTGLRRISRATVQDAIDLAAWQHRFHPVRDYLNGLVWDGEQRIYGWLSRYLGVEGGAYADMIGRLFLIALVARIFQPGCKADYMLILEGPQGVLKSAACRALAGEWFSDNLPDLSRGDPVRLSMHLCGKWLIEIAELSSFNAAESHTLKEFLTQTEERYVPKYGRNEVLEPRQCLFVGSTNEKGYLRDATGARRFWPVLVGDILLAELIADRDQLFAEAVKLYREGAPWWPERTFETDHIKPQQTERYESDPWEEAVIKWIATGGVIRNRQDEPVLDQFGHELRGARVDQCTVTEVLIDAIGMRVGQIGTREQRRMSAILLRLGWTQKRTTTQRLFQRPIQGFTA